MKKLLQFGRLALIMAVLLSSAVAQADTVSRSAAGAKARAFFQKKGITSAQPSQIQFAPAQSGEDNSDYYYIFNAGNDRGFVIISGDDRAPEILGYADEGSFDPEVLPDHIKSWLTGYADEIKALIESPNAQPYTDEVKTTARTRQLVRHAIKPLVTTKWNQGEPYNLLCPNYYKEDGETVGGRCVTGCVATAIAQIMNFYKYPKQTKTNIPLHTFTSNGKKVTLPAIAKGRKLKWDLMTDTYNDNSTEEEKMAVAELMFYCGQGVKMGYGPSSGAASSNCLTLLKEYMGYDDQAHMVSRWQYDIDGWTDVIYSELAEGYPIYMAGSTSTGAHAFIIDGYDGEGLFHVNWGWGGGSNGYFRIAVLNPGDNSGIGASSSSDGYSMGQDIIIGVRLPDRITVDDASHLTVNNIQVDGDGVSASWINWSGKTGTFFYALAYMDEGGNYRLASIAQNKSFGINNYYNETLRVTNLQPGTYHITPVSRISTSKIWKPQYDVKKEYIIAEVDKTKKVTLTYYKNPIDVKVDTTYLITDGVVGHQQEMNVLFRNNTDAEYYGEIHFFASMTNEKGEAACRSAVAMKPRANDLITYYFTPEEEGMYHYWLAYDSKGNDVLYEDSVMITKTSNIVENLSVTRIEYDNNSGGNIYDARLVVSLTISNRAKQPFDGDVQVRLWNGPSSGGTFWGGSNKHVHYTIPAGRSVTQKIIFEGLEYERYYHIQTRYCNTYDANGNYAELDNGGIFKFGAVRYMPGIISYHSDGRVIGSAPTASRFTTGNGIVAVDLRNAPRSLSYVRKSNAANCVYILRDDATVPASLAGCNIIQNGVIDTLRIVADDLGFYSPVSFVANTAIYTVPIDTVGNGAAWTPIVFPFMPTDLTINDTPNRWRRDNVDSGDIWIKKFAYVDNYDEIGFDYADKLEADVPYIYSVIAGTEGNELVFSANDVAIEGGADKKIIASTDSYSYLGTTMPITTTDAFYTINEEGNAFVRNEEGNQIKFKPFKAYFKSILSDAASKLTIPLAAEDLTAIAPVKVDAANGQTVPVYSINGTQCGFAKIQNGKAILPALPKGIYIVAGKKYVR